MTNTREIKHRDSKKQQEKQKQDYRGNRDVLSREITHRTSSDECVPGRIACVHYSQDKTFGIGTQIRQRLHASEKVRPRDVHCASGTLQLKRWTSSKILDEKHRVGACSFSQFFVCVRGRMLCVQFLLDKTHDHVGYIWWQQGVLGP